MGNLAAEFCKDRPPLQERFIDYAVRQYPSIPCVIDTKARGSTLTSEEVNDIVSASAKAEEWSRLTTGNLTRFGKPC